MKAATITPRAWRVKVKKMSSESNSRRKKIVTYHSIVGIGILLLLSLISVGYFSDFNNGSVYGAEWTPTPGTDSGLIVYIPNSNSTETMPDTEEEADVKTEIEDVTVKSVSGHIRGGSVGEYPTTSSDPLPMDLKIKDQDEDYKDGVTATWTMSNMMPGDSVTGWLKFINKGDSAADHLTVNCTAITIDPPGPESDTEEGTTDLDKEMIIAEMRYYYDYNGNGYKQIDCLSLLNDMNGNGNKDLDDLEAQTIALPPPGMTDAYATNLSMIIQFSQDAGNDYQGDILNSTFRFTLIKL